ncbi:hypothetical protein LXL04_008847 [Taraxacum kok-saghyz]
MSDMMKLLEMAMTQQQETFAKMMADQNAVNHQFTVHGNPIGDSGRNQNVNPINSELNMETKQAFETSECDEQQKVRFTSQMFLKQALDWWNIIRDNLGSEAAMKMPWSYFKHKVIGNYCNQRSRDRMEDEFRGLQKGSQTIAQYSKQFI